jgi:hypothetical protein
MKFDSLEKMASSMEYHTYYFDEYDLTELTVRDVIDSFEGFLKKVDSGDLIGIEREIADIYDYHFNRGSLNALVDLDVDVEDFYGEICIK